MTSVSAKTLVAALAVCVILLAGCKSQPVNEVIGAPIPVVPGKPISMEDISKAIVRAGTRNGWLVIQEKPGRLSANYRERQHGATVEITHDEKAYNIKYRDSTNLNADAGQIHKVYNVWVANLDRSIRTELVLVTQ